MTNKLSKAMILAAGFGTRLKPLTINTPKALVMHEGIPLIEHVLVKLISAGIDEIVINIHHFSEQMEEYFRKNDFGIKLHLSKEKEILGTGGGIKNTRSFLEDSGSFLVYNADVISGIDIPEMYSSHISNKAFVTLAVSKRESSRPLLFNENNNLAGYVTANAVIKNSEESGTTLKKAFCGVHILSSEIFSLFPVEDKFDIIPFYSKLAENKFITFFDIGSTKWKDMGKYSDFS